MGSKPVPWLGPLPADQGFFLRGGLIGGALEKNDPREGDDL